VIYSTNMIKIIFWKNFSKRRPVSMVQSCLMVPMCSGAFKVILSQDLFLMITELFAEIDMHFAIIEKLLYESTSNSNCGK
jgi:hypothetical protein